MSSYSTGYQKTLVDAIFHEKDQQLRKAFRERMEKMERRDQLAQVSGIHDEAVLDRLIELDIGPETLAALEVVPLVFVAWADGTVQAEERETIIAIAKAAGIQPHDDRYPLLEHWLKRRPGAEMIHAWKHYVKGLCQRLDSQEIERLQHELLDRAREVARATGGFLGFGDKMSPAERSALDELEQAFA
jgi:DnaJ-domain-containing protein 1